MRLTVFKIVPNKIGNHGWGWNPDKAEPITSIDIPVVTKRGLMNELRKRGLVQLKRCIVDETYGSYEILSKRSEMPLLFVHPEEHQNAPNNSNFS